LNSRFGLQRFEAERNYSVEDHEAWLRGPGRAEIERERTVLYPDNDGKFENEDDFELEVRAQLDLFSKCALPSFLHVMFTYLVVRMRIHIPRRTDVAAAYFHYRRCFVGHCSGAASRTLSSLHALVLSFALFCISAFLSRLHFSNASSRISVYTMRSALSPAEADEVACLSSLADVLL
jgi:hypothetical protein